MSELEYFRYMCRYFDNETADLYRREWVRDGDRDREELIPAGKGWSCHLFGDIPVRRGDAAKADGTLTLWLDGEAPFEAGMKIIVHRPDRDETLVTCGPADDYESYKSVKVRLEQIL